MALKSSTPSSACAISVIIPVYNAEKYIGECLESILNQTFQDFEVIVVNDCSTDNSRQEVEKYLEKFDGRLQIYDNLKNSKAAVSRNRGLLLSRGEYVYFMDADDLLMLYGLEKMYELAKRFDADAVGLPGFYKISEDATKLLSISNKNKVLFEGRKEKFFVEEDILWRLQTPFGHRFYSGACLRLLRRDFLIKNEIFFPENVTSCEDVVWKHGFLLLAKRIVHTSFMIYFYRMSDESLTRTKRVGLQYIRYRMNTIFYGIKWIDNIMSKSEFFTQNPEYRYKVLAEFTVDIFKRLLGTAQKRKWSPFTIYQLIRQEFGNEFGEYDILVSIVSAMLNDCQETLEKDAARIAELEGSLKQGATS